MDKKIILQCDLCGSSFQFGPHRYDGRRIPRYQITVCMPCWEGNWDGWGQYHEERLISHLMVKGIPIPERNSKGWFPRE